MQSPETSSPNSQWNAITAWFLSGQAMIEREAERQEKLLRIVRKLSESPRIHDGLNAVVPSKLIEDLLHAVQVSPATAPLPKSPSPAPPPPAPLTPQPSQSRIPTSENKKPDPPQWNVHFDRAAPRVLNLYRFPFSWKELASDPVLGLDNECQNSLDSLIGQGLSLRICIQSTTAHSLPFLFLYDPYILDTATQDDTGSAKSYVFDIAHPSDNQRTMDLIKSHGKKEACFHTFIFKDQKNSWYYVGASAVRIRAPLFVEPKGDILKWMNEEGRSTFVKKLQERDPGYDPTEGYWEQISLEISNKSRRGKYDLGEESAKLANMLIESRQSQ